MKEWIAYKFGLGAPEGARYIVTDRGNQAAREMLKRVLLEEGLECGHYLNCLHPFSPESLQGKDDWLIWLDAGRVLKRTDGRKEVSLDGLHDSQS